MPEKRSVALLMLSLTILLASSTVFGNSVNNDNNAAFLYIKAGSMLTEIPKSLENKVNDIINNGWKDNNEELKEILTKNQGSIKEFKRATKLAYCDFKLGKSVEKTYTAPEHKFKEFHIAKLIIIQGRLFEKENKLDAAFDNYLSVLKYSDHLNQQKNLICIMYGAGIQKLLYAPLAQYISTDNSNIEHYRILLDNLLTLKKNKIDFGSILQENKEYTTELIREYGDDVKKRVGSDEILFENIYKELDRLNDEYYGYWVTAFEENRPEMYKDKIKQFKNELKKQLKASNLALTVDQIEDFIEIRPEDFGSVMSPSLVAKIFFLYGIPEYCHNITKYYVSNSKFNILTTAVAVKLYELENAKLPDSLQELMPMYFSRLPEDPFNDFKLLKYEKKGKGWVVYSFGPDKQDNHGTVQHNEKSKDKAGDIVFSSS